MGFNNDYTAVTGATYTAAQYNTHTRDNFAAVWVFTAAGDMAYAASSTSLARLAKPSVDSILQMGGSGVPSWLAKTEVPGRIHTTGSVFSSSSGGTITTANYVSIGSGVKFDLTLTVPCTIIAWAHGMGHTDDGTNEGFFALSIDGTIDPNDNIRFLSSVSYPFACMYRRTGIAAGTRTVELKFKAASAGDAVRFEGGAVHAIAIVE